MAAPSPSSRVTPSGRPLGNGYQTTITFASVPNLAIWEVSVQPPGLEAEDGYDTSTMLNTRWRTKIPRRLITMGNCEVTARYDPALYTSILTLINQQTTITIHFPWGDSLAFYGFLRAFVPDALSEDRAPEARMTIVPTNTDPSTCTEEGPTYTADSGTAPC